ncbi:MAG TPA: hypothetical protein VHF24_09290 [Acidimicrobiales bacterium]|nr:hypothetical protein [Acidimicrobiales bacterium]
MSALPLGADADVALPPPRGEELTEEEQLLYERVVQRDESALLECFDRVGHVVYCMALLCSDGRASAEELTETVFVRFWQDPQGFGPAADGPLAVQLIRRMTEDLASGHEQPGAR